MVRDVVSLGSLENMKTELDRVRETLRRACGRGVYAGEVGRFIDRELAPLVILAFGDSAENEARAVGVAFRRALSPLTRERPPT